MPVTTTRRGLIALAGASVATIAAASPAMASTTLSAGQTLTAGLSLLSPNGAYRAVMQGDGNLVVYGSNGGVRWASATSGRGATWLAMQSDGNLVLYTATGQAVWATRTVGTPSPQLVMQNDGNLVMYDGTGRAVWSSNTGFIGFKLSAGSILTAGQQITSLDGGYRVILQGDGNLVQYTAGGGVVWATMTMGSGATWMAMQSDGNLVLYTASGAPRWSSGTGGMGPSSAQVQGDGNLVVYRDSGPATWSSKFGLVGAAGIDAFRAWVLNPANWNSRTPSGSPGIDADGAHGAQCADLGISWSARVGRRVGFDGWDGSGSVKPGWRFVAGNFGSAQPGDVITRVDGLQHVVVVVASAGGGVQVLQQNPGSPAVATYPSTCSGVIWRQA